MIYRIELIIVLLKQYKWNNGNYIKQHPERNKYLETAVETKSDTTQYKHHSQY
ncbi:MAG: hypothetical protein IT271_01380 [Chitinophagales bacterium]|nr:hypothetical protein [Chitinophagales bacterium]